MISAYDNFPIPVSSCLPDMKLTARRAGLLGKYGSSFVRLTMPAHHDETGNALSLPVLSLSKDAP